MALLPDLSIAASPVVPQAPIGSGQILQQVQPTLPPLPKMTLPPIREKKSSNIAPSGVAIKVVRFRIEGNTLFKTRVLHSLVANLEGHTLTFEQIEKAAGRLTRYYRVHGYLLSLAFIPNQTVERGVVTIRVKEARFGKVHLHNGSRVSNSLLNSTMWGEKEGHIISSSTLNSNLLLMTDIPGTNVTAALSPGTIPGTSDLDVDVTLMPIGSGNIFVNDYGNPYTGSLEMGGTGYLNNLLHHGDLLTVNATTALSGMNYGRISYEAVLNGYGTRMGAAYSAMDYRLGGGVDVIGYTPNSSDVLALGANGYAQTVSGWISQPLLRKPDKNMTVTIGYDRYILSDTYSQSTGAGDNRFLDAFSISLAANETDSFWGNGRMDYNLSYDPYYLTLDAGQQSSNPYAKSTPGFRSLWKGLLSRTQSLPGSGNTLFLSSSGQMSTGALDPSMQFVLGGPTSVRAYSTAILFGDQGYLSTAELRHVYSWAIIPGTFQSSLFFDSTGLTYAGSFVNLMGPGMGESWQAPYNWFAKLDLSIPVGGVPAIVGTTSPVQVWLEIIKSF